MAITKTVNIDVNTGKAVANTQALNNEINKTNKEVTQTKENLSGITSVADGATGGAISKFQGLTGVVGNVSKGFTTLKGAIIGSGIGALVIIIASVISAFKASEEGQNKFAKIMGVIGSVVGNVIDVVSDLGEVIIGVLSGDSKAIKSATDFGKKIFDVVGLPIKNMITVVETLAKTLGKLFSGDISGAFDQLKSGVNEIGGNFKAAANSINSGANALKNFGQEALREAKIAQQIADQRAKADKTDRQLIVQRAEADRRVAELREKALDREKYNTKQRIGFLNEASKVEQDVTNKEIQSAILRRNAIVEENKLSKSNKDALKAEEEAKAAVINLETKRLNLQKALTGQISALKQQEKAENQAAFNERKKALEDEQKLKEEALKKEIEDEKKRAEAIENLRKSYAQKIEDLEDTTELQKIERQQSRALAELDALKATEEQKVELITYYENLKNNAKKKEEEDYWNSQAEAAIKRDEEAKKKRETDAAEDLEFQKSKDEAIAASKQNLTNIISGLEESGLAKTKAGQGISKAIALTQIGIDSAVAISKASTLANAEGTAAQLAFPMVPGIGTAARIISYASTALSVVSNIARAKKLLSSGGSSTGGSSGGGGGGSAPTGGGAPAPQFNVVGNSGVNQIAQTLGSQQPVQAYVVASNVTTQQSLDRNIVANASLG
jgi:hypothetical protein